MSEKIGGCYWGIALGDALGKPVEFNSLDGIIEKYGLDGIQDPPADAIWTDDTQMTLAFTRALLDLGTPEVIANLDDDVIGTTIATRFIEWLADPGHAPGATCMKSVHALSKTSPATWQDAGKNESKGCGTVMRAAPAGAWFARMLAPELDAGAGPGHDTLRRISAIQSQMTHGHPAATAAAIANAYSVALAFNDVQPATIIQRVRTFCDDDSGDLARAFDRLDQALAGMASGAFKNEYAAIVSVGQGWVADEAIAMALFAVACHPDDFKACLRLAANHGGDSDSVASIAGGIIGALNPREPDDWKNMLLCSERARLEQIIERVCGVLR
jgi:ADP-ribosylglycohydrolase